MSMLLICRGLPASGKSTWAKAWVNEFPYRMRVNRDDIRYMLFGKYYNVDEKQVTQAQHSAILSGLNSGYDVVSDDTNLSKFVKDLVKLAAENGHEVEWNDDFLDVDVRVCIDRDSQRYQETGRAVGQDVILDFHKRYLQHGRPKRPVVNAPDLSIFQPYHGTPGKPKAFLVDLDGTIALNDGHRGYFDWHKVGNDQPVEVVIMVVRSLINSGLEPLFVSGRDAVCWDETWDWINKHVFFDPRLFMRSEGDMRKDSIVKLEIFDREIRDHFDVKLALDDRDQVVRAYRDVLGLPVFQVRDGSF